MLRYKGCKVKEKGRVWKFIPLAGRNRFSTTFGDTIYLSPKRWADFQRENPRKSTLALLEHEACHVEQWRRDPNFKRNYVKSRKHRLQYEAEACARQIHMRITLGTNRHVFYYLDKRAKLLASKSYLLFKSYDEVWKAIHREYKKLIGESQ